MFKRHDEVTNVRAVDLDRELWLMLLGYPLDAISFSAIAKSIFNFALLKHVHESEVLARVVLKAVLHDERKIPPDVVVSTGFGTQARSFTIPVYVLSKHEIVQVEDEQPVPPHGLAHPLPHPAPGWLGPIGGQSQAQQQADE